MAQDPPYQVFASYSPADRAWVETRLLPRLEEAGVRTPARLSTPPLPLLARRRSAGEGAGGGEGHSL
jgi:hypothetical protein